MAAVRGNAQAEGDFLGGAWSFALLGLAGSLHFAFPFQSDQAPTRIVHLRQVSRGRQDADPLSHTIDFFHGGLPLWRFPDAEEPIFPHRVRAICMPQAGRAEATESKRLPANGTASADLPTSAGGIKVSRCRTPRKARKRVQCLIG